MNLQKVAADAVKDASNAIGAELTDADLEKVTAIISSAMEDAVRIASSEHSTACVNCMSHDQDLAHKIQQEIKRKEIALIANLSSMR